MTMGSVSDFVDDDSVCSDADAEAFTSIDMTKAEDTTDRQAARSGATRRHATLPRMLGGERTPMVHPKINTYKSK
ncbi:unnamed protein product [Sphacelaria rigidula]